MNYYLHPLACCESSAIGENSRIGAFSRIFPGARVGAECNVGDHVTIENGATVGDRVTIQSGVKLGQGTALEDDVFLGSNATFATDPPSLGEQSRNILSRKSTVVRRGSRIGANATISSGVDIGTQARVEAGAVVTHDVPPYAKVVGNPARIVGYTDCVVEGDAISDPESFENFSLGVHATLISGVSVYRLPYIEDLRGNLSVGEFDRSMPFSPKRYFLVFDVPNGNVRGEHAHKHCHQFLVCIKGSCAVVADDGNRRQEILLDRPNKGLHVPPMIWGIQYKYSPDATLLVFASDYYDVNDYIRSYDEYRRIVSADR